MTVKAERYRARMQAQADRELQAVELRRQGFTYAAIAKAIGYADHTSARAAIQRAMQRALQEPAEELRQIEAARLDYMQEKIWGQVDEGDPRAVQSVLRIMERRAKLLGLDAPTEINQNINVFDGMSDVDREVQRLAELLSNNPDAMGGSVETVLAIEAGEEGTTPA